MRLEENNLEVSPLFSKTGVIFYLFIVLFVAGIFISISLNTSYNQTRVYLPMLFNCIFLFCLILNNKGKIVITFSAILAIIIWVVIFFNALFHNRLFLEGPFILNGLTSLFVFIIFGKIDFHLKEEFVIGVIQGALVTISLTHIFIAFSFRELGLFYNSTGFFSNYFLGVFHNPTILSNFLLLLLPLILWGMLKKSNKWIKLGCFLSYAFILTVFIINKSRVCILASFFVFTHSIYYNIKSNNKKIQKKDTNKLIWIGFIGILFLYLLRYIFSIKVASTLGHKLILKVTVNILKSYFWLGTGFGSFPSIYNYYQSLYFRTNSSVKEAFLADNNYLAHSELIQTFSDLGFVGFIFTSTSLLVLFVYIYYIFKKEQINTYICQSWISWLIVLGCLISMSHPFRFLDTFNQLFFILIFYSLFFKPYERSIYIISGKIHSWLRNALLIGSIWSVLYFVIYIGLLFKWEYIIKEKKIPYQVQMLKTIIGNNSSFLYTSAHAYFQRGEDRTALEYIKLVKKFRVSSDIFLFEGDIYWSLNKYKEAMKLYEIASFCVPKQILPKYKLMTSSIQLNDTISAVKWAKCIVSTPVKISSIERDVMVTEAKRVLRRL